MIDNKKDVLKISKSSWLIHKKINVKENIKNSEIGLNNNLLAII